MPHKEESKIIVTELHPTFAAEVRGVDFSKEIADDVFQEVQEAITKVSAMIPRSCDEPLRPI